MSEFAATPTVASFMEGRLLGLTGKCPGRYEGQYKFTEGFFWGTLERMGEVPAIELREDGTMVQAGPLTPRTPFRPVPAGAGGRET